MRKPMRKPTRASTTEPAAIHKPSAGLETEPAANLTRSLAITAVILGLIAVAIVTRGCGSPETYGEPVTETSKTVVSDILQNMDAYAGKTVRVEGKIATECPSGCWFELAEGGAMIYVDMAPHGFAIPQYVGKNAVVQGTVVVEGKRARIHAKGVEIH
jgi:hypothetical protein